MKQMSVRLLIRVCSERPNVDKLKLRYESHTSRLSNQRTIDVQRHENGEKCKNLQKNYKIKRKEVPEEMCLLFPPQKGRKTEK